MASGCRGASVIAHLRSISTTGSEIRIWTRAWQRQITSPNDHFGTRPDGGVALPAVGRSVEGRLCIRAGHGLVTNAARSRNFWGGWRSASFKAFRLIARTSRRVRLPTPPTACGLRVATRTHWLEPICRKGPGRSSTIRSRTPGCRPQRAPRSENASGARSGGCLLGPRPELCVE